MRWKVQCNRKKQKEKEKRWIEDMKKRNNIKCKKRGTERKNNCKNKNQKNNCDDMSSIKCEKKKKKEWRNNVRSLQVIQVLTVDTF